MKTEVARTTVDAGAESPGKTSTGKYGDIGVPSETAVKERPPRPNLAPFRRCDPEQPGSDSRDHTSKVHNKRLSDPVHRDPQDRPVQNGHVMGSEGRQNRDDGNELPGDEGEVEDLSGDEYPADAKTGAARRSAKRKDQRRGPGLRAVEDWQPETRAPGSDEALDKTARIRATRRKNGRQPSSKRRRLAVLRGRHGVDDRGPAAANARGRPRSERADVLRGARTSVPVRGLSSGTDVSQSSTFLGHAAGRSWSARCGPALFAISVVSAGVLVCMSFQVFSVLRTYGAALEGPVQNRTNDDSAAEAHRAATASTAVPTAAEDEDFETAPNSTDVE
ncbi:hypothetical protein V5799_008264 [Amblyomma americanum]|uniref:Transmembrane protein n=1 Tax=Amblyomma americanum TaxID=6943 RepID=A0AAQ4FFA4_AMBAM